MRRIVPLFAALAFAACAAKGEPVRTITPLGASDASAPATTSVSTPAAATSKEPRLTVSMRPITEGRLGLHVEIKVSGAPGALRIWSRADASTCDILHAEAADADGVIALTTTPSRIQLGRDARGDVTMRYDVLLRAGERSTGLTVMTDRFVANGETTLVLPDTLDDTRVAIVLAIDTAPIKAPRAASSLGVGEKREATRVGRFLRRSTFVGGSLGTAILDAAEGHDEAAWLGYTAFDVRAVVGELAQVRTGFADYFHAGYDAPMTYVFLGESRRLGSTRATARAESVVVRVGAREPWSAALRLTVAQQMLHTWIGGVLWIGPAEAGRARESAWFVDGVARYLASRLLRRFGTLSPAELRDALVAEIAEQATSTYRGESLVRLAGHDDAASRALLVARGALYAWRIDAEIRKASQGKRSIDDLLRALYTRATELRRPLPATDFVDVAARDLGQRATELHAKLIDEGAEIVLPEDVLGRCFKGSQTTYAGFDLGFDEVRTEDDPARRVQGLAKDGPAANAGVREGDVVESTDYQLSDATKPVTMRVVRAGQSVTINYLPRGRERRGATWTRVAGMSDEACGP